MTAGRVSRHSRPEETAGQRLRNETHHVLARLAVRYAAFDEPHRPDPVSRDDACIRVIPLAASARLLVLAASARLVVLAASARLLVEFVPRDAT